VNSYKIVFPGFFSAGGNYSSGLWLLLVLWVNTKFCSHTPLVPPITMNWLPSAGSLQCAEHFLGVWNWEIIFFLFC